MAGHVGTIDLCFQQSWLGFFGFPFSQSAPATFSIGRQSGMLPLHQRQHAEHAQEKDC